MWIERRISARLESLVSSRPIVVVTGARQTGKTSLIRHDYREWHYTTLDLPAEAAAAETNADDFLRRHPSPLVIDEVQYAPTILRHLKYEVDRARSAMGRFLLTGSQKFLLMHGVSESLAGRAAFMELLPLAFDEIAAALPGIDALEVVHRGGYPELYEHRDVDSYEFYRSYVVSYLERDVRSLLAVGSLRDFERFIRACALRSGQLLNKAELARDVGISPPTAHQWLSVLEAANQITLLEPWFSNKTKSMVKTPKLYLNDTGLMCFLLGIRSVEELHRSPVLGGIWETFVHGELRKQLSFVGRDSELFFWRDRGVEVDFLVHQGGRFRLFEAKSSQTPNARDADNLKKVIAELGEGAVMHAAIVGRPAAAFSLDERIQVLGPGMDWLENG